MKILEGLFTLLLFQVAGTAIERTLHIPIPGPVLGMVLLALYLGFRPGPRNESVEQTADALLVWLPLLFIPAGVGVITELALLRAAWLPISVALIGSTFLTLAVTAATFAWITRRRQA